MRLSHLLLVLMLSPLAVAGEFLVIPHLASDARSFQTWVILENRTEVPQNMQITAYAFGEIAGVIVVSLEAGERRTASLASLFPEKDVLTHMFCDRRDGLFVGVEYVPVTRPENRTYVEALRDFSQRWRIHPSNWQGTFDGVAIVNPGCYQTQLSIVQRQADGSYVAEIPLKTGLLDGFNKLLFNLGQVFQPIDGSYVEISADHPIAVVGLKGSLSQNTESSFLVGNQAEPYPQFEQLLGEVEANRLKWHTSSASTNYSFTLQGSCFCPHQRAARVTVSSGQLSELVYVEDGTPVGLAETRNYSTIAELFDLIEAAVKKGADHVSVDWNSEFGYPNSITIDWLACAIDEEQYYLVSGFQPHID